MNKYRNIRDNEFDSKAERRRYEELLLMQYAGEIRDLRRQHAFHLLPKQSGKNRREGKVDYIADFTYYRINKGGQDEFVVEDVKSEATRKNPTYVLKRKLMLYRFGISVEEYIV